MKKLLTILAVAAALAAVSCTKEREMNGDNGPMASVSFTVNSAELMTKADPGYGQATAINQLLVQVFNQVGTEFEKLENPEVTITPNGGTPASWKVDMKLAKNETYKIAFWAQKEGNVIYGTDDLSAVTVDYSKVAINNDDADAFCAARLVTVSGSLSQTVVLYRPLAQINIGTNDKAAYEKSVPAAKKNLTATITLPVETPNKLNVIGGTESEGVVKSAITGSSTEEVVFATAPSYVMSDQTLTSSNVNYSYLTMLYVLSAPDKETMTFKAKLNNGTTDVSDLTISNMPYQANYRTNIVGQLLTGSFEYNVEIEEGFYADYEKLVSPTFASLAELNTYLAGLKENTSDGDHGDINPEQVTLTALGTVSGTPQIVLPKINGGVDIRLAFEYDGTMQIVYAEGATDEQKPANIFFYAQKLKTLEATVPASHFELLSGSIVTNKAIVATNTTTFVIQNGAKVGTAEIQKGNATIAGTVTTVSIPTGAKADDDNNPVQVRLEKVSAVDKIELKAKTDVVVEQPKDQIEVEATEKKVAVYVKEGAENSTAKAQNGGVIYVKAEVPCTVTADGTSEAEDGSAVSSTVIIEPGAAGSAVIAENGGAIDLTANGNCSASADGVAEGQGSEPDTPSSITVTEVKDNTIVIDANASEGGEIETNPDTQGAVKYFVARIGDVKYESIEEAISAVQNNQTIVMLVNITQDDGILFDKEGVNAAIDLDGKTIKVNKGSNVNNRAFRIDNGTLEVYGGSIVAVGEGTNANNGTGCYGAFRVEANGVLNAHDLSLSNARPWGLNVKVIGGAATLNNVSITSSYGGGIEVTEADLGNNSKAGSAILTNCHFTQTGYYDHCSTTLSVSGGSALTINGGSYESDNYALYVFSSGGEITVNNGTFSGNKDGVAIIAAIDLNSYPNYTGGLKLKGGEFHGGYSITSPAYMEVTGGSFSEDPSAYVPEGYIATYDSTTQMWTVGEDAVAQIGTTTYGTLVKAFAAVKANEEIVVLKNCEVKTHIDVDKSPVTLNLNGFTVTNSVTSARMLDVTTSNGQLTIKGEGKLVIDANQNVNSYGFVRLQAYGSKFILDHAELEGVTQNAALLRFNNGGQSMEIKNNSKLTLTAGPNVENKGRGTIIYNYGMSNTLSITDTDIYNYCEAPQWSSMIAMENRSCTFENVRYYSETGPTGFYTGAATYTNCSIELQRTGTLNDLNIDKQYPWLASAVSTSLAKAVTINSGTYKGYYGIFVYSSGGDITVKDGTFEGTAAVINSENNTWQPGYAGASSINIEGGDFTGKIMAAAWGGAGTSPVAAINISGGKFKVDSSEALFTPNNASILVSGGVFSQDPTPYLKSGYKVIDNPDANADVYPYKVVAE